MSRWDGGIQAGIILNSFGFTCQCALGSGVRGCLLPLCDGAFSFSASLTFIRRRNP